MAEKDIIRIVIADNQYFTCKALDIILKEKFNISGFVSAKQDLFSLIAIEAPDLVIIDPALFDFESFAELRTVKNHIRSILVFTNEVNQFEFNELNNSGIENILLKTADEYELLRAIELCLKGKKYYSEEILELIVEKNQRKNAFGETIQLTQSEMEIVKLIVEGLTTKQIAARKFLSFHTVMTHRKNIFRKAGVKSVSELLMFAVKSGWIENIEYYI